MKKSDLVEYKALVLSRFGLVDAQAMCGHDVPCFSAPELSEPCPACGSIDLRWLAPGGASGRFVQVADACDAVRLLCRHCGFDGDAVTYVMANYNISRTDFALQRIEDYLAGSWGFAQRNTTRLPPKRKERPQRPDDVAFRMAKPQLLTKPPRMAFRHSERKKRKRVLK